MKLLITGGAGFIGSNLIELLLREYGHHVVCIDKLCFPGSALTIERFKEDEHFDFEKCDIADGDAIDRLLSHYGPDGVFHLAAESHVDRSIDSPRPFLDSNVVGTFNLLQASRRYLRGLDAERKSAFRFLHVSTDEVFGSLEPAAAARREDDAYRPNSPYAASKASADMLVRAWVRTYGFPAIITICSNNYGPYQFPEKLIPLVILKGMRGEKIPVYGDGKNVRDWLHVYDHTRGLMEIYKRGRIGETYNISANNEHQNVDVVRNICRLLDEIEPRRYATPRERLISFVPDRPGHDRRYAIDNTKIRNELGWEAKENFETALRDTVRWYIDNKVWCDNVMLKSYAGQRLGLGETSE